MQKSGKKGPPREDITTCPQQRPPPFGLISSRFSPSRDISGGVAVGLGWGDGIASSHHLRRGDPGRLLCRRLCSDLGGDLDGYSRLSVRRR